MNTQPNPHALIIDDLVIPVRIDPDHEYTLTTREVAEDLVIREISAPAAPAPELNPSHHLPHPPHIRVRVAPVHLRRLVVQHLHPPLVRHPRVEQQTIQRVP